MRTLQPIEDDPEAPQITENGIIFADRRVYMLLERVELKEAYPRASRRRPLVMDPVIRHGLESLQTQLGKLNYDQRKVLVMELAERVTILRTYLDEAPTRRRGRAAKIAG